MGVNAQTRGYDMNWRDHLEEIARGRLVVYPTETFYALGCAATVHASVLQVFAAKRRPLDKPLPSIVGDWEMAEKFLYFDPLTRALAERFWPGPLSIILPVTEKFSSLARDAQGRAAVRMTPHPVAAQLCSSVGVPLVSSSANRSGRDPVCDPRMLDAGLVADAGAVVVEDRPLPGGGKPSTLVEMVRPGVLHVLRHGAVTRNQLEGCGYGVLSDRGY